VNRVYRLCFHDAFDVRSGLAVILFRPFHYVEDKRISYVVGFSPHHTSAVQSLRWSALRLCAIASVVCAPALCPPRIAVRAIATDAPRQKHLVLEERAISSSEPRTVARGLALLGLALRTVLECCAFAHEYYING
jgi:hypothetical protein